jgi:hypothetical protein
VHQNTRASIFDNSSSVTCCEKFSFKPEFP